MTIYMITTWCPSEKIDDVTKIAAKVSKLPPSIKKWQQLVASDVNGIKSYNIIYAKDDQIADAQAWIARVMMLYYEIEGFKYKWEFVMSLRDAQKVPAIKI